MNAEIGPGIFLFLVMIALIFFGFITIYIERKMKDQALARMAQNISPIYIEACKWADKRPIDIYATAKRVQKSGLSYQFHGGNLSEEQYDLACEIIQNRITSTKAFKAIKVFPKIDQACSWIEIVLLAIEPFLDENRRFFCSDFITFNSGRFKLKSLELDYIIHGEEDNIPNVIWNIQRFTFLVDRLPLEEQVKAANIMATWCSKEAIKCQDYHRKDGILADWFQICFWLAYRLQYFPILAERLEEAECHPEYVALLTYIKQLDKAEEYLEGNKHFAELIDLLISQNRYEEAKEMLEAIGEANYDSCTNKDFQEEKEKLKGLVELQKKREAKKEDDVDLETKLKLGEITDDEYKHLKQKTTAKRLCLRCGQALEPTFNHCPRCGMKQFNRTAIEKTS